MAEVYLLFGTNLGNKKQNIYLALQQIELKVGTITSQSSIYETAAWGNTKQQSFYNKVICVSTNLLPQILLDTILTIEQQLGRVRNTNWEPRIIDIDILYYDELIVELHNLIIPHPLLHQRMFTLMPLVEIASTKIHPKLLKSNSTLLEFCTDRLAVKKLVN